MDRPARARVVAAVAARHGLRIAAETRLGLVPGPRRRAIVGRHLREACEDLGPSFVKLGQLLSVRPDLAPIEWLSELEQLQEHVPPAPTAEIRRVLAQELGMPIEQAFASFDDRPFASASVAQVHIATLRHRYRPVIGSALPAGSRLAVKVLRPGVEDRIADDLALARRWAGRTRRWPRLRRYRLPSIVDEFASSLQRELDLRNEGRVADRFAHDFANDDRIVVPRVVWPRTTRRVLTAELIDGWRLSELGPTERAGIDAYDLAVHGARAFLRQVLELGRFHADLHPANLLVTPAGRICYLDFGIVGRADAERRSALARLLAATAFGDADLALQASRALGLEIPAHAETKVRDEAARLIDTHLRRTVPADVRGFATGFLTLLRRHGIAIPTGYGLLVKGLLTVEGVARGLYPDLDVVEVARPMVTRLVARERIAARELSARLPVALQAGLRELAR